MGKLILFLLALPVLDLVLLVRLGNALGAGVALGLAAVSGVAGLVLARALGLRQLTAWRQALAERRTPDQGIIEALLTLLACAWLVVPGLVSDVLALLLFVPPIRRMAAAQLGKRAREAVAQGSLHVVTHVQGPWQPPQTPEVIDVIDVEAEAVTPDSLPNATRRQLSH
jgi:UPF0716 protein FxsA